MRPAVRDEAGMLSGFLLSTGLIFVAELGDKSQLVALWFATRYRWWPVLAGVTAATLVVHLAAVAAGRVLDGLIPEDVLRVVVGLSFMVFAWGGIRRAEERREGTEGVRTWRSRW